jgi:rSAM/selenodomain-associated transferase 2
MVEPNIAAMISVIIPALNEAGVIANCIESLREEEGNIEIIAVDGGSVDGTPEIISNYNDIVLVKSPKGRGRQMNEGAGAASGDVYLFLHADTILEQGWSNEIMTALGDGSVKGGAFTLAIDSAGRRYRLIEHLVRLRCALWKLPYGDQGIFVRRGVFERIGGYKNIPLMEDVDLVERIKREGRISILPGKAITSHRRWEKKGWIETTLMNQVIMVMYRLGIDTKRLAEIYYG